jgi:hypothetical protein
VTYHVAIVQLGIVVRAGADARGGLGNVRNRSRTLALLVTWMALAAGRIEAQFDQYRTPGGPGERPERRKEALEKAVEKARWRFGALRVDPWAGVKNVDYVDNVFGVSGERKTGDLTATGGAGLRAYLRTGPKLTWAAHALPEYVWWRTLTERRRLDGHFGVGAFGFGNRLSLEATATREQVQQIATPEVLQAIHTRTDRGDLTLEAPLGGAFSLFGSVARVAVRNLSSGRGADPREAALAELDRDETLLSGGLRWNLPGRWSLGLGVERSEVDFVQRGGPFDHSNSGIAPLAELRHEAADLSVGIQVAQRSLDPKGGASFAPYRGVTAEATVGLRTDQRLSLWLYGRRNLVYSIASGYSYLRDDEAGVAARWKLGWRTGLRVYGEAGRQGYAALSAAVPDRRDTSLSYGAEIFFSLSRGGSFSLKASRSNFRSNLPGLDRAVASFGAGVSFGGTGTWY